MQLQVRSRKALKVWVGIVATHPVMESRRLVCNEA
jgi:hypothetical protein